MKILRKIIKWFDRRRVEKWLLLEYVPILPEPYEGYNRIYKEWHELHREHVRFFSGEWSDEEKAIIKKRRELLGNPLEEKE